VEEGDTIAFGDISLKVLHTPGHSAGSISLVTDKMVFVGDVLFAGSIGRTDFPGGDHEALIRNVREKIFPLGDDTIVYPGHGPRTTVGRERKTNPFFAGRGTSWL
jgi:hydroxyacylglutathione hydrolase